MGNDNYEKMFSLSLGFYGEDNDKYNTRVVDCDGSTFYIRIPKEVHNSFPNIERSGYITIGGFVLDSKTILAVGAQR
jgi:hypothetical protein